MRKITATTYVAPKFDLKMKTKTSSKPILFGLRESTLFFGLVRI
jgi:hypothetical protein